MKLPRLISSVLFAAVALTTVTFLPSAHGADRPKILIDFSGTRSVRDDYGNLKILNVYDYAWNDWQNSGVVPVRGKGTLIRAISGKGNLGENNTRVRFGNSPALLFLYVVGGGNEARNLSFKLVDANENEAQWTLPLEGKPKQQLNSLRLDLAKPDSVKAGKKGSFDPKRVNTWEVMGDWQSKPTEVLLVSVAAVQ